MTFSIINRIKNTRLKNSIHSIAQKACEFHSTPFLYSFTDHSFEHSKRMLICINKLLDGCNQRNLLNEYECYILAASIYLHDVGIQVSKNRILKDFSIKYNIEFNDDLDKASFVRNYHHLISAYLVKEDYSRKRKPLVYDGDEELGKYISYVIESHGINFSNDNRYTNYIYHNDNIRVKLLSVLLCLADCFDCDNRRIDSNKFKYTELPKISRIHWMKHLYVSGISFNKRIITISYTFPNLTNKKEVYQQFFCKETEYWIEAIRENYLMILNENNLLFELKHNINYDDCIENLDIEDYSYIEEKIFDKIIESEQNSIYKKVSIGLLIKNNKVLMVQRRKVEKSFSKENPNFVLQWQFPAGVIKTKDSPEGAIIREVLEETGLKCTANGIIGKRLHPDTLTLCYYILLDYNSGRIKNGDTKENSAVAWFPLSDYKDKVTSNIYWKIEKILSEVS